MVAEQIAFGVTAFAMAVGAVRIVTTKNIVHAALWLMLVLAGVAANFILLAGEFVAVVQVLIYIEGHKDREPPRREGGKPRTVSKLDRFDIDYGLCMYCGICVEVCPFDALHWSPEFEYSEPSIGDLLHDKVRLGQWERAVPVAPDLEAGAEAPKGKKK